MKLEDSAKGRLVQTFKFLKELNELRNPVPRDISGYAEVLRLDSWPAHPCIVVWRGDRQEEEAEESGEPELEPLIRIQRAGLTLCPKPPELLKSWLKPGWQAAELEAMVLQSRNFPDQEKGSITVEFAVDEERVRELNAWKEVRSKWAIAERPAIVARQLFEKIHALWTTLQREGGRVELVLADGMLSVVEHFIRHPVLMQRVNLEFDPSIPEFRFHTGSELVDLHRALLRLVPSVEGRMIAHFVKELETQPVEPLGGGSTEGFFRRLVQGLFNDGEFLEGKATSELAGRPNIRREPVIFLRPRTAGLSTTLDYILEDLESGDKKIPKDCRALSAWKLARRSPRRAAWAKTLRERQRGRSRTSCSASPRTRSSMQSPRGSRKRRRSWCRDRQGRVRRTPLRICSATCSHRARRSS